MADNAGYAEDNSLPEALAFQTACTVWLTCWAFGSSRNGQSEMEMPPQLVQAQLDAVRIWIAGQPAPRPKTAGNVVGISVRDFRGEMDPGLGGPCGW